MLEMYWYLFLLVRILACTHVHAELELVLVLAVAVLDGLGEEHAHLEEEDLVLALLLDEPLGLPHGEAVLQQHILQQLRLVLFSHKPVLVKQERGGGGREVV